MRSNSWLLLPVLALIGCPSDKDWPDQTDTDSPFDTEDTDPGIEEGDSDNDGIDDSIDCEPNDADEPVVVDASSGSSSGDGTLDDPMDSIQDAIDMASSCVYVYGGTYDESIDFSGKDLLVWAVDGPSSTTIDARSSGGPAVTFASGESDSAILSGFTIKRGEGELETTENTYSCSSSETCTDTYEVYCGGGVYINGASPTLTELVVRDNSLPPASTSTSGNDTTYTYSFGGAICSVDANPIITDVVLRENYADQGGALYVDEDSRVTVARTWLVANGAEDGGGVHVDGGQLTMVNVLSTWNEADSTGGGVLVADGELTELFVTHGGEDAASGAGIYLSGSAEAAANSTIIYGSSSDGVLAAGSSSFYGVYNNVYGNGDDYDGTSDPTGSDGNISSDPRFTDVSDNGDPLDDDWTLSSSSPSVDAGDGAFGADADGSDPDQGAFGGPDGDWSP